MDLTKQEIEELSLIEEYLQHSNPEIVTLGYSLYKSKYESKFKDKIMKIYPFPTPFTGNYLRYRCEYFLNYWNRYYNCDLGYAIHNIINYDHGY